MAKLPLYAAGITATFTTLLIAAAAEDAALLKQAQGIFQPLPKHMATAEFPITRERVELGRSLFFDPRLPDEKAVIDRLARIPGYAPLFKAAFPDEPQPMTLRNIATAVGAYERMLVTPSPFDAYLAGNQEALPPAAKAGLEKFINTGCVACHNGVGVGGGMYQKFGVVEDYWKATGSDPIDKGRFDVTKDPNDLYVFRVASLRNVAMTPPYFHDGSVATLPEAVKVMARVQLGVNLDDADIRDIVAFLQSLTGELPANFATAPVLPSGAVVPAK